MQLESSFRNTCRREFRRLDCPAPLIRHGYRWSPRIRFTLSGRTLPSAPPASRVAPPVDESMHGALACFSAA